MYNPQPLKAISTIFLVLGWATSLMSVIASISFIFEGAFIFAAYIFFGGIISGVLLLFLSYLATLFLKIEDNTRKTAKILYLVHQNSLDDTLQTKLDSDSTNKTDIDSAKA